MLIDQSGALNLWKDESDPSIAYNEEGLLETLKEHHYEAFVYEFNYRIETNSGSLILDF